MTDRSPRLPRRILLGRLPRRERVFLADTLRQETVGGMLLLVAALLGLVLANSAAAGWYEDLGDLHVGPAALGLDLSLSHWAADGFLAIFFFIAGLELKRELVVGTLRRPADAAVPIIAAAAGMAVPALIFLTVTWGDAAAAKGWAIPMATDIAFALAVLAVVGTHLPAGLRAFLLTLAIVDDMGAITIIATFYTEALDWLPLLGAGLLLATYAVLQRRRRTSAWIYVPLAFVTWWLMYESGVHATIAGVLLGLLTRVKPDPDEDHSPAERLEHRLRPLSAAVAVPLFAFFSAGVTLADNPIRTLFEEPAGLGVVLGLVVGKFVGVFGATWLLSRFTRARLDPDLSWSDVAGLALLAGIGFTVSLLISELAFADDPYRLEQVKTAVLVGSLVAAVLATLVLRRRNRFYRAIAGDDRDDSDDGDDDLDDGDEAEDDLTEGSHRPRP